MKKYKELTVTELKNFLESENFSVSELEPDGYTYLECETWTNRGVNMLIYLEPPTVEELVRYVNDFDIDEQIDLHREGERYRQDFTIAQSLKDFTNYKTRLKNLIKKLLIKC